MTWSESVNYSNNDPFSRLAFPNWLLIKGEHFRASGKKIDDFKSGKWKKILTLVPVTGLRDTIKFWCLSFYNIRYRSDVPKIAREYLHNHLIALTLRNQLFVNVLPNTLWSTIDNQMALKYVQLMIWS